MELPNSYKIRSFKFKDLEFFYLYKFEDGLLNINMRVSFDNNEIVRSESLPYYEFFYKDSKDIDKRAKELIEKSFKDTISKYNNHKDRINLYIGCLSGILFLT